MLWVVHVNVASAARASLIDDRLRGGRDRARGRKDGGVVDGAVSAGVVPVDRVVGVGKIRVDVAVVDRVDPHDRPGCCVSAAAPTRVRANT